MACAEPPWSNASPFRGISGHQFDQEQHVVVVVDDRPARTLPVLETRLTELLVALPPDAHMVKKVRRYCWTFPRSLASAARARRTAALRAVTENTGVLVASTVDWVPGKHTATSSTTREYALMVADSEFSKPISSKHFRAAIWPTGVAVLEISEIASAGVAVSEHPGGLQQ
jgi:hypothetical protein